MKIYPDAKVILSVRDAEGWPASFRNSVGKLHVAMSKFPGTLTVWLLGWSSLEKWTNKMLKV